MWGEEGMVSPSTLCFLACYLHEYVYTVACVSMLCLDEEEEEEEPPMVTPPFPSAGKAVRILAR